MPKLITTKLGNGVRDRIVQEIRRIIATVPGVVNNAAFAKRIGVNPSHLTMWSKKKGYPSIEHLARMRKEFGIDVNALIDGAESKAPLKSLADFEKRLQLLEQAIKKPIKNNKKGVM